LVVASSNPLQGVSVEHQIPGSGVLAGVSAFAANETLSFTVTGGAPQTFTLTSTATPAQLVTRVNDAVAAGTLSGVTAYLNASGEFGLRATDPEEGVSLTYTKTDTTTVSGTGTAAASLGTMTPTTAGLPTNVTLTDLVGWVDTLDIGLDASVIQVSSSQYALNIRSKDSGAANSLQVSEITFAASITAPAVSGTGDPAGGDLGDYVLEYDSATAGWTLVSSPDPVKTRVSGSKVTTAEGHDLLFSYTGAAPADGDRLRFSVAADGSVGSVSAYAFRASQSLQAARDAYLSVNGLSLSRASNTIDDVVEGLTIDLTGDVVPVAAPINSLAAADFSLGHVQSASIRVTAGATDLSAQAVKDFANAYNELIGFYKTESASSTDPDARGVLNGDSSLRSYMERLRSLYSRGLKLADGSTLSFNSVGVEFQRDGKLYVDESKLNAAVTDGLQEKFAAGIKIGVESDTMNFTSFMTQSLQVGGLLAQHLLDEEKEQVRLQDRIDTLETKMTRIEERLYKQYAALDALLFRLQTTSNALASAIDSMTANQGG
jgi:flagellar hook-associated protein 2